MNIWSTQIGDSYFLDKPVYLRKGKAETVCIVIGFQTIVSRSGVDVEQTRLLTTSGTIWLDNSRLRHFQPIECP
jgi:hypothetical protein